MAAATRAAAARAAAAVMAAVAAQGVKAALARRSLWYGPAMMRALSTSAAATEAADADADQENKFLSGQDVFEREMLALARAHVVQSAKLARDNSVSKSSANGTPDASTSTSSSSGQEQQDTSAMAKRPTLIDVRSEEEVRSTGRIPGALVVPLTELEDALRMPGTQFRLLYQGAKPPRDTGRLVFYCKAGARAAKAVEIARAVGFRHSRRYAGSIEDWVRAGNPVEGGSRSSTGHADEKHGKET